jgi:hypothetical protein
VTDRVGPEVRTEGDLGVDTASFHRCRDRGETGVPRVALLGAVERRRAGHRPPVVQDFGHVGDAAGLFREPQDEVVVLRAVVRGVEGTDLTQQGGPEHREVRGEHLAQQSFRRPLRLREGDPVVTLVGHDVLVGVHVVDVDPRLDGVLHHGEGPRVEGVVVIEQRDECATGRVDAGVRGLRDVAVLRQLDEHDPWVGRGARAGGLAGPGVGGGVVDEHELPVLVALQLHRRDHLLQEERRRVVQGHDDGELRSVRDRRIGSGHDRPPRRRLTTPTGLITAAPMRHVREPVNSRTRRSWSRSRSAEIRR